MKPKVNILDEEVCNLPTCKCGAWIKLGFLNEDFEKFKAYLEENYEINDLRK